MPGEFYKMDYEAWDEGTDVLTLEQEAAYLRLCHQMYRRKAPIPSNHAHLARIWRCHPNKARKLLADLLGASKLVEIDGHLTNTRVTRELDERETRRRQQVDAGHTGGTRTQDNRRKSLKDNEREEALASEAAKRNQAEREKEIEGEEIQTEDEPLSVTRAEARSQSDFPPKAFEAFWDAWPNKVGKAAAERKFETIRKSGRVTFAKLMAAVASYIASKPPTRDWCHPTTWLNQGRWDDQPAPTAQPSGPQQIRSPQDAYFARAREADANLRESTNGAGPFDGSRSDLFGAGRRGHGYAHPDLLEPVGGDFRFSPPRLAGPPRPN